MPLLLSQAQAAGGSPFITVNGSASTVLASAQIEVSVANGPGTTTDWVGLSVLGSPDDSYTAWDYLSGTQTAPATGLTSATFMMIAPQTPSVYQARFYFQNGFTILARIPFIVQASGAPVLISSADQINRSGTYSLQNDIVGDFNLTTYSNVTLLGNNHQISGLLNVGGGDATSGIVVQDLTVGALQGTGNAAAGQTALTVHMRNITVDSTANVGAAFIGSNMLIENCDCGGDAHSTDDCAQMWYTNPNRYVTFDGCTFGMNFDSGLEGLGGWDHVTIRNCQALYNGIDGVYGPNFSSGDRSSTFSLTNCTFTNNRIQYFAFSLNGRLHGAGTDQIATNLWGPNGNTFSGNIYG